MILLLRYMIMIYIFPPLFFGSTVNGLSVEDLASSLTFTAPEYFGSIPENSVGKVYVRPNYVEGKDRQRILMGVRLSNSSFSGLSIKYRIRSGDPEEFFKAESEIVGDFVFLNVRIRAGNRNVLNRERKNSYTLDIKGVIRGSDRRLPSKLKTTMRIKIIDTNDLDPFFQLSHYSFSVNEDAPLHTQIGSVHAEDADEGINGEIYYFFSPDLPKEVQNTFSIDPVSGSISLLRNLDYTESSEYRLRILAMDRGMKPEFLQSPSDSASVLINVERVNIHDPVMTVIHLPEVVEQSHTDVYAIIRVKDSDLGRHGDIRSVEIIEGDPEAHFRVTRRRWKSSEDIAHKDEEFNIRVLRLLDREISPYGYNLTLKATDNGVPSRSSYKVLHVQLADFNDHPPIFNREIYEVRVNESVPVNTPLTRLKVTDADSGRNAETTLSIVGGNNDGQFRINPTTGVLYVAKPLDSETRSSYTLAVTALDKANIGMRKQSSAKVRIYVADTNDNDPSFDETTKEIFFDENQPPGTKVTRMRATDKDSGENGYISYNIANLNDVPFEIDHFTGVIKSTKLIDYETDRRIYKLRIRASDWGTPFSRQVEMKLIIRIRDVNDNRPQFERVGCKGKIPRDLPSGSDVLTLSALDFDAGSIVLYRIESGNADLCFGLDESKGILSVLCDLRTLPSRHREIKVTATDGQHFSDLIPIKVEFVDTSSNKDPGSNAIIVSSYGVDSTLFRCKQTSVSETLTKIMALEEKNNFKTSVSGEDEDYSPFPSRFGMNIHAPIFISDLPSTIRVNETIPVGSKLLKMQANDRDLGFNGFLRYVISSGDDEDSVFRIDTLTGDLVVDEKLDREKRHEYNLKITVFDSGIPEKSAFTHIRVIVEDENDNPPIFMKSSFSFFFPENTRPGTNVVTLNATDPDSGLNGIIKYSLETETSDFKIDPVTGLLSVSGVLDREKREYYDLTIRAKDSSQTNPLSSFAVVRIRVLDVNDEIPIFTSKRYSIKAREDLPVGSVLGSVHASDPDLYEGGIVRYSFDKKGSELFGIDPESGSIRILKSLDFEDKQLFNLTIIASDGGPPSLSSKAYFVIEVLDVNENIHPPRFSSFFLSVSVPENRERGTFVTSLIAKDADKPGTDDSKITYSIRGGSGIGAFIIDPNTGDLQTYLTLDRETQSNYWITVYAQDHGAVPLFSSIDVYIRVLNVNDNVPYTKHSAYEVNIVENSEPYTEVLTLEAFDDDDEHDKDPYITFEIVGGNPQSLFRIDSESGVLTTTNRILDRETQSEHVLRVRIDDNGFPPLNSTILVFINVTDVNDNKPTFLERYYKIKLPPAVVLRHGSSALLNDQDSESSASKDSKEKQRRKKEEEENASWNAFFENSTWEAGLSSDEDIFAVSLFRTVASDPDIDSKLGYSLKTATVSGKFKINSTNGIIHATETLHPGETYDMLVKAQDGGGGEYGLSRVSLSIISPPSEDLDTIPISIDPILPIRVLESDSIGRLLTVVHARGSGDLFYDIIDGDEDRYFYVTPDKGGVILAERLNVSRKEFFNLTIRVRNGRSEATTSMIVNVVGSSDGIPKFSSDIYLVNVTENSSVGTILISKLVTTSSSVVSLSRRPLFSIYSSKNPSSIDKFNINPYDGKLTLKKTLDGEISRFHELTLAVKDQINPNKVGFAKVKISVIDQNDHIPRFLEDSINTRLLESADIGSIVVELTAVDNDLGNNGRISYSIESGNVGNSFDIDPNLGILRVARQLDMTVQGEFMLSVRATDHGRTPLFGTVHVHIILTMSDDAPPVFLQSSEYSTTIFENKPRGTYVLKVEARSRSSLRYDLFSLDTHKEMSFRIQPSTGIIITERPLDYEKRRSYNLMVQASDMYGSRANASVRIHIMDLNDNVPIFESGALFKGRISETASIRSLVLVDNGSPLVIKAEDADSGINSLLKYEILEDGGRSAFIIDESTGAVRTASLLDHETKVQYKFRVRVSDRGVPSLSSELLAVVQINVVDENDTPPKFIFSRYSSRLLLPTYKDVAVVQVEAVDPDLDSNLEYSLSSDDKHFRINPSTGEIFVLKPTDIQIGGSLYDLEAAVSDGKYKATCSIKITIEKSENSGLAFGETEYHASVMENSTKPDVIAVVSVLGASLNENLRFYLLNGNEYFTIGQTSGAIKTTGKPFDREVEDRYEVVVEARSGERRKTPRVARVIVNVRVLDLNDNAPFFVNKPYYAVMPRDTAVGETIIKVSAVDYDIDANGEIFYQLVRGNGETFRVEHRTGAVTLRKAMERYKEEYSLVLAAHDGGAPHLSAEVLVVIKIVEESVPSFRQKLYRTFVPENLEAFTPILSVEAEPASGNEKSKIIYTIASGNEEEMFEVDYDTGAISVLDETLDYETKAHYQLIVRGTDTLDGRFAEAIVLLDIENVNDCAPSFINESYVVSVPESASIGYEIVKVKAVDADSNDLEYFISDNITADFLSVNSISGLVTLKKTLDYERERTHVFTISVTDNGAPGALTSEAEITIQVLDINDNAPFFEEEEYFMKLCDSTIHRGQFVGTVRAIDKDGEPSPLKYSILDGDPHQIFSINQESGIISVLNLRQLRSSFPLDVLNVTASDGVFSAYARVRVELLSGNAHAPSFPRVVYNTVVEEDVPVGTLLAELKAVDGDINDRMTYSIVSDLHLKLFKIDSLTGQVFNLELFDREVIPSFEIPVMASDIGGRNGFTNLKLTLKDVNDNPPQFELSEYKANIHANISIGSSILSVFSYDLDQDSTVSYSIYEDEDSSTIGVRNLFKIRDDGQIILKKSLMKLQNQVYQFFVRADDGAYHSDVPVEIYVMTPADRPPVFERLLDHSSSLYYVNESATVGSVIVRLTAGKEGFVKYRSAMPNECFDIDELTGRVFVSGLLDREEKSLHQLVFSAETDSSPALSSYFRMTVQILDVNDNPPVFNSLIYEISLSENVGHHSPVLKVQATDKDFGNNGEIRYSFGVESISSPFNIDAHSGWITTTTTALDFESDTSYKLVVLATDNGNEKKIRLSATCTVNIEVMDFNDNPPQFIQRAYSAAVNEEALPGTIIFQLETTDKDTQYPTDPDYYVTSGDPQGRFRVKKNREVYVSRHLDREYKSSYQLEITATDGTFVSRCKVSIEILDDNDNPPRCPIKTYFKKISEDTKPGTYLFTAKSSDKDDNTLNADNAFILTGVDHDYFSLDPRSGDLITALPLDRETRNKYDLKIIVRDKQKSEWQCSSNAFIQVTDFNDNAPTWRSSSFVATLKEDTPIGTIATKVHARDADLGINRRIRYYFTDSFKGVFKIDSVSGIVTLAKSLDRESKAVYNLSIKALDQGSPKKLASVTQLIIAVSDVNDNPPEFASRYYFASVNENAPVGYDVVRVLATSKDVGVNAEISYSIVGGNERRTFKMHPKSGVIVTDKLLDHERFKEYYLTVEARDGGDPPLSNRAAVNITILDVNDNAPTFEKPAYSAFVDENASYGETILVVKARDADSGHNGIITYHIKSGDRQNQFKIHPNTGEISVTGSLDREMISSYVLEIAAKDEGSPRPLGSTVLVNIDVSDINDNPPIFPEGNYTVYVQEDKELGFVLLRFSVTDADESPNAGPFTFDIRSGNEERSFRIVQDGTLRTATKFNHKIKNQYLLQIRVFDNGTPPLYSDSYVNINVIEESRYPPIAMSLDVAVNSYEDDFPGAVIGKIHASDQDPYDKLTYELVSGRSFHLFQVDRKDGEVLALQGLDVGIYDLNISVSDGKFTTYVPARVRVDLIEEYVLEYGVIVRLAEVSPEDFVVKFKKSFIKIVKTVMDARAVDVIILSIQPQRLWEMKRTRLLPEYNDRSKRSTREDNLDVLFAVRKNDEVFYDREIVRKNLLKGNKFSFLSAEAGMKVLSIQSDVCENQKSCNGECRETITMDESEVISVSTDASSFVSPVHEHRPECVCRVGYGGQNCDLVMNDCAKDPCPTFQRCSPDSTAAGYSCVCPKGFTGPLCNINVTNCLSHRQKCTVINPISFNGRSFAEFNVVSVASLERRLSLSFGIRTKQISGTILFAYGLVDYCLLELSQGKLRFKFNFGSGEGIVTLEDADINDGKWHQIVLERVGNSAKLKVGSRKEAQGSAPGINDVLNLDDGGRGNFIYFGARVGPKDSVDRGFIGCLDDIRLDGIPLPLHHSEKNPIAKLSRLNNIDFDCSAAEMMPPGPCGSYPCLNGGSCSEIPRGFTCNCLPRFTGSNCEIDSDPCRSSPCLHGGKCINLRNDFHCECPPKLSGKRCHYGKYCNPNPCLNSGVCEEGPFSPICQCRGFTGEFCAVDINECLHQNPCGNGGTCINSNGGFHCICPPNSTGLYCNEDLISNRHHPSSSRPGEYFFNLEEVVAIIASLFGFVLLIVIVILCRKIKFTKRRFSGDLGGPGGVYDLDAAAANSLLLQQQPTPYNERHHHHHHHSHHRDPNSKANTLEMVDTRPLLNNGTMIRSGTIRRETDFNYADTVRSYGQAAEELGGTLPRIPPEYLTIGHTHVNSQTKPVCSVAPSISHSSKVTNGEDIMWKVSGRKKNLTAESASSHVGSIDGAAVGASSLPEDRYYWDSFDLGNQGKAPPVEREIETLNEETETLPRSLIAARRKKKAEDDEISATGTEGEPQLGSVFPAQSVSTSFEHLLAVNGDIGYADDDADAVVPNEYDYALHPNNYLPTHNVSSDTDEQTPMLSQNNRQKSTDLLNNSFSGLSSTDSNGIGAIPPPLPDLGLSKYSQLNGFLSPTTTTPVKVADSSAGAQICELEEDDDEPPIVGFSRSSAGSTGPRVTRV